MMNGINQAMIDVRGVKQGYLEAGNGSPSGYPYQVCFKIR